MSTSPHPVSRRSLRRRLIPLIVVGTFLGAQPLPAGGEPERASLLIPAIRNARVPLDGVLAGGQPTREQLALAAEAGFRTVINLRTEREPGWEWEDEFVSSLGMTYELLPISGRDGLTRENVEKLDALLSDALERGPVMLHCASGNRVGGLLGLRRAWLQGEDAEDAVVFARAAGLTSLTPAVKELLGVGDPTPSKE